MAKRHIIPAKPQKYAFCCPQEDPVIYWYLSPPINELEPLDEHFIENMKLAYRAWCGSNDTHKGVGSQEHLQIISALASDEPYEGEDIHGFFPDSLTVKQGMEKMTKGWIVLRGGDNINKAKRLAQQSSQYQLLIYEANDWC